MRIGRRSQKNLSSRLLNVQNLKYFKLEICSNNSLLKVAPTIYKKFVAF